jgi:hypothetical protein
MTIEEFILFFALGVLISSISLIGLCLYLLKQMWDKIEEDRIP